MDHDKIRIECLTKEPKDITPEEREKRNAVKAAFDEAFKIAYINGYRIMNCLHDCYYWLEKAPKPEAPKPEAQKTNDSGFGMSYKIINGKMVASRND